LEKKKKSSPATPLILSNNVAVLQRRRATISVDIVVGLVFSSHAKGKAGNKRDWVSIVPSVRYSRSLLLGDGSDGLKIQR